MSATKLFTLILLMSVSLAKAQNNIRITSYYDLNDKKSYYIAWDIKTGKSIQYYWNGSDNKWESLEINLPEKPITGALGNIMIDLYYDHKYGKAYYTVWDTKTGRSIQYYWNNSENKWSLVEVNLPITPLPGNTGEVMIKSYYSTEDNEAYYIVYDTNGGKSIQYFWNESDNKWESFEINLPEKPLLSK